jgi:glycosyltransferase involved in cell wall biosynthesis
MISIIICSRDLETLHKVSQNIEQTIGVAYEIIAIDNSKGEYGICQAYNVGARQSKFNILCFMHEDLSFHTPSWGSKVVEILADNRIGVLGVAGGTYQLKAPVPWWFMGLNFIRQQVIHTTAEGTTVDVVNPQLERLADVAVADGLWLCSRKAVWEQYPFDEMNFAGFHFYDVDYCTAIFFHYRICVTFDILIEHYSKGTINETWLANALKYQRKWKDALPFGSVSLERSTNTEQERRALLDFINQFIPTAIPSKLILGTFAQLFSLAPFSRESLGMAKRFIQKRVLS